MQGTRSYVCFQQGPVHALSSGPLPYASPSETAHVGHTAFATPSTEDPLLSLPVQKGSKQASCLHWSAL